MCSRTDKVNQQTFRRDKINVKNRLSPDRFMKIGIIILAAGPSLRFGETIKQLLTFNGTTLVRKATETALAAQLGGPVVVVVGASKDLVAPQVADLPVTVIENDGYEKGVASSIKTGLVAVHMTQTELDAVIFLPCDQPLVSATLLKRLAITWAESGRGIVSTRYEGQLGTPVLLGWHYLDELLDLEDDRGTKWIVMKHKGDRTEVVFEPAALDLNSWRDVERVNKPVS